MSNNPPANEEKSQAKSKDGPYELTKGYEIDFEDDSKYHVKIGLSKLKKLKLTVTELSKYNNIYEAKFDHEELIAIDKFFGLYDSIEDVVEEMDNLFTKNCIAISLDMNHNVVLEIQISINNKPRIIRLLLTKKGNEQAEALNNLCQLVSQQTKKLDSLQKENAVLKEKVGKLNEKLDSLKNNPDMLGSAGDSQILRAKERENSSFDEDGDGKSKKKKKKKKNDDDEEEDPNVERQRRKEEEEKFDINNLKSVSKIIKDIKDVDFIIKKINNVFEENDLEFYNMNLIYSATEDGDACTIFHSKCDGVCPILALVKTKKGKRFGGFTTAPYQSSNSFKGKKDDQAFIFSIDKKKTYEVDKGANAICCYKNYGPVFYGYEYCNIYLIGNFLSVEGNVAKKGDRFKTTEDYELNGGDKKFLAVEVEVYQVILKEFKPED